MRHTRRNILPAILLATSAAVAAGDAAAVYRFEPGRDKPGPEWSHPTIAANPDGTRRFLGEFSGSDDVRLRLTGLRPHKLIRIRAELLMLRAVDGSSPTSGPDVWEWGVVDGPRLLQTTFGNCGVFSDNNEQAYPDAWGFGKHPAWTGSQEKQTLGYVTSWGSSDRTFNADSVYVIEAALPHTGPQLELYFRSHWTEPASGEAWGLGAVEVIADDDLATLSEAQARALVERIADPKADPIGAAAAVRELAAAGDAALPAIREAVGALPQQWVRRATQWIADLEDERWKVRAEATKQLKALGHRVAPLVRKALADSPSPEAKARLQIVLDAIDEAPQDTQRDVGTSRLIRCLEAIGSAGAGKLLLEIEQTSPSFMARCAARDAFLRSIHAEAARLLARANAHWSQGQDEAARNAARRAAAVATEHDPVAARAAARLLDRWQEVAAARRRIAEIGPAPAEAQAAEWLALHLAVLQDAEPVRQALEERALAGPAAELARAAVRPLDELDAAAALRLGGWYAEQARARPAFSRDLLTKAERLLDQAIALLVDDPDRRAAALDAYAIAAEALLNTRLQAGEAIDLLPLISGANDAVWGQVARTTEGIVLERAPTKAGILRLPLKAGSYEINLRLISQPPGLDLLLPCGDKRVGLVLNGFGGDRFVGVPGADAEPADPALHRAGTALSSRVQDLRVCARTAGDEAEILLDINRLPHLRYRGPLRTLGQESIEARFGNQSTPQLIKTGERVILVSATVRASDANATIATAPAEKVGDQ